MNNSMGFNEDIIQVLEPKFGHSIRDIIEKGYSDEDSKELYMFAVHMLTGLVGRKNAKLALAGIVRKYPRMKLVEVVKE